MLGNKHHSSLDHPSKVFEDVRFVLFGFDPLNKANVLKKLVDGGGVDVGQLGSSCTHVIVHRIVSDDPICVAARSNGTTLVTGLWVDHSFDAGMAVDPTSIMYKPLRDLNGIPGAKSRVICLTGYQHQDREDIMTMVGLMGANFSKPLVAHKVTHLVCYKFEGEKYELAKKIKKIRLVNHQWLADCLRSWEILSEVNYDKSGYELEMEAEAKDSEEEAEDMAIKQYAGRAASPQQPFLLKQETFNKPLLSIASKALDNSRGLESVMEKSTSNKMPSPHEKQNTHPDPRGTGEPPHLHYKVIPENDLSSTSKSERSPNSDAAKFSVSYSRKTPRRTTPPVHSGEIASNLRNSIKMGRLNLGKDFDISSSMIPQEKERADAVGFKTPSKESVLCCEEANNGSVSAKRKRDIPSGSSKLQKTGDDFKAQISKDPFVPGRARGLQPDFLVNDPFEITCNPSSGNSNDTSALNLARNFTTNESAGKSSGPSWKSATCGSPISKINASEAMLEGDKESVKTYCKGLKTSLASKTDFRDVDIGRSEYSMLGDQKRQNVSQGIEIPSASTNLKSGDGVISRPKYSTDEIHELHNEMQDILIPTPSTKILEIQQSPNSGSLELQKGGFANSDSKPIRRKIASKKFLGPKRSSAKEKTTIEKGSIYLKKSASRNDYLACSSEVKTTADPEKFETVPQAANSDVEMVMGKTDVPRLGTLAESKSACMDDETEPPEDKDEAVDKVGPDDTMGVVAEGAVENETMNVSIACGKKSQLGHSTCAENHGKKKNAEGKKRPLSKSKKKAAPFVSCVTTEKSASNDESVCIDKNEKIDVEKETIRRPAVKTKKSSTVSELQNPMEVEKENVPVHVGDGNRTQSKEQVLEKGSNVPKAGGSALNSLQREYNQQTEPVWFILSGHRLQRKEFQQVIRRLKGRVCRDSHHWSYQATHFIVPDPIRRTEKFFAAAASGRWILKTEYLTASNQAGKFLSEEPYEWHKNGLSEDGAINLESPRKWRVLKQKTGHGAFYGMRIIIYGECIAPPLDTLKRAVKAGDGTILATSPPYTRFLKSGVDFAVVSPGMPSVDVWVQEFLRHEIPCVVPDYLVEYVCKSGYSLERHVQYSTHAWAEKSLNALKNRLEEIDEPVTPPSNDDVPCQVCGLRNRGDVMLICGDESGSTGCGIGAHIDCCDPPFEEVPEGDWFCAKCCESKNSKTSQKNTKKRTASKGK